MSTASSVPIAVATLSKSYVHPSPLRKRLALSPANASPPSS